MEIEHRTPLMAKNLLSLIRSIIYIMKKGVSKNIPWFELHMLLKRSTKLAGKAIGNLNLDHQTLSCRPNNIKTTFINPVEYEFSCSNTPLFNPKRKHQRLKTHKYLAGNGYLHRRSHSHKRYDLTVDSVKKAFDDFNNYESPEKSPLTVLGFGGSGNVRQLRVTDSPFPVNNTEEDVIQVDKAAERFIKSFYEELKQQKNRAAVEPPSPLCYRRWGNVR
ncbi:hypothetical protein QVD17_26488 [Tagetes erecta]|uniref:Uncharacterized protein n=1 Tax=Tagetes erecta TaxID=13708 RepID=A0AAD8NQV6_TARER|nr:hypothetical protein QVD17_26488 [Tagetes erecta]